MKSLLNKKLIVALTATIFCVTILKAQIPEQLKNLWYFKQRAMMLESLRKQYAPGKLNDMRCGCNAPCITALTTLGGSGDDYVNKNISTADGGFVVVGGTNSTDGDFHVPAANGEDALCL
jgi:hypothetical protein